MRSKEEINNSIISDFLTKKQLDVKKILYAEYKNYAIKINFAMIKIKKDKNNVLQETIDDIMNFLISNNFQNCCQLCGNKIETQMFLIDGKPSYSCKACQVDVINEIAKEKENLMSKRGNILTGMIGGIIGALIGGALWVAIYSLGYIASVAGLAIAVCTIKGFEMFGGKLDKLGIMITFIITIIMVYFAQYASLGFEIYEVFKGDFQMSILEALRVVPEFLLDSEISRAFYLDLGIGYLLTLIGSVSTFVHNYNQKNFNLKTEVI